MVPVLDKLKKPLMPCSEKRARKLMEKGEAKAYFKNGIFCIILQKEPSARNYQEIVAGIDTGSKREGYTIVTRKKVVLNLLTNTPDKVKRKVETRAMLRGSRRQRKTPYRKCRLNRKIGGVPPSTKARWNTKLRILKFLLKIVPLTTVNIEDIKVASKKDDKFWNKSFSPLETGKNWFYPQIEALGLRLFKTQGEDTKVHRDLRNFIKSKEKLLDIWEAHNVDSHSLCEIVIGNIEPFKGLYRINFFNFHRRQLHEQIPDKHGFRRVFGGTVSQGITRGTLVEHNRGRTYIGGTSNERMSLHCVKTGKRLTQNAKKEDLTILSRLQWRTYYSNIEANYETVK